MKKYYLVFIFALAASSLFLSIRAAAESAAPSPEAIPAATVESVFLSSAEASAATTEVSTTEVSTVEGTTAGTGEGTSYKGVPWGTDFNTFKAVKGFGGYLGPFSAALIGTADDNDIALLLGIPVSGKEPNGSQRVMFEYLPRKFASVYFDPDDTHYIFYNGKFALTFSKVNKENFDFYRDTFYKKYAKCGKLAKRYEPTAKQSYLIQIDIFEKGKTTAFLINSQFNIGKKNFVSTKLVFASNESLEAIRREIQDKLAAEKLSVGEKEIKQLEKDLNKIE